MLSPHTSVVSSQFGCKRLCEARGPASTPGCSCSWGALALLPAPLPLQPPLPLLHLLLPSASRQLGCAALGGQPLPHRHPHSCHLARAGGCRGARVPQASGCCCRCSGWQASARHCSPLPSSFSSSGLLLSNWPLLQLRQRKHHCGTDSLLELTSKQAALPFTSQLLFFFIIFFFNKFCLGRSQYLITSSL